ncbi:MAG: hypothetical protein H0V09_06960 [Gemmatimonadetes bacterium]|nr:hypothetical protein [Gemmatimonadota bacterium]
MSRILDALAKAQRESSSEPPRLKAVDELPIDHRDEGQPSLAPLPDRDLTLAQFTQRGLDVLARSYESVERACAMHRGVVPAGQSPARILLVIKGQRGADAPAAALAVAATLAEKMRSRALLVDCTGAAGEMATICRAPSASPGLAELALGTAAVADCVLRTELGDLFFLPAGVPAVGIEAASDDGAAMVRGGRGEDAARRAAIEMLARHFAAVVLYAGEAGEAAAAAGLTGVAEAVLRVGGPRAGDGVHGRLEAGHVPVVTLSEFVYPVTETR